MEHTPSLTVIREEFIEPAAEQSDELRATSVDTRMIGVGNSSSQGVPASVVLEGPPTLISNPSSRVEASEAAPRRPWGSRFIRRLTSEGGVVALTAFAVYLTVAILLDFKYRILPLDAVSRMANGYYGLW